MIIVSPILYLYGVVAALILHYEICVYRYIDSVPALAMRLEPSWLQICPENIHT